MTSAILFSLIFILQFAILIVVVRELLKARERILQSVERENALSVSVATEKARADNMQSDCERLRVERETLEQLNLSARTALAAAEEKILQLSDRVKNRTEEELAIRQKFASDFENLSNKIYESAREKMSASNLEQVGLALAPLKTTIKEFRERIETLGEIGSRNNASMQTHIETLAKMNNQLGEEARNLTAALRSNNKVAGNWGETVLLRIFESCGFIDGVHFRSQKNYPDSDGLQKRLMPDYVVYLPENRSIVVDSKLSLVDFVNYCSSDEPVAKRAILQKFKKSVREHLSEFAGKYNNLPDITCGFKMMFMPVEGAYDLIVAEDPQLLSDAYEQNVLIVGPTSVMTILKFAEIAYRNEAFSKNIKEICKTGNNLYKRVELFAKRFEGLGAKIVSLQKDYSDTRTTLSQGSRSVLETAKRFIEKSKTANIDFEEELDDNEQSK